ncbi:MAG: hypothetical protein ABI281_14320 [Caldimonas sp.]
MRTFRVGRCIATIVVAFVALTGAQAAGRQAERRGSHVWIDRAWELRYVIDFRAADAFQGAQARATRINAAPSTRFFRWEEFFIGTRFTIPHSMPWGHDDWMLTQIDFDPSGQVTSPNRYPGPLRGRINRLRYLALSAGDGPRDRIFTLGSWFTGLGDASTGWAPALCGEVDMPVPAGVESGAGYRYGPGFDHPELTGTFGCREWAFQLYDDGRPYIDVTSYVPQKADVAPKAFIRDFLGFARFGDSKPVIGQQNGIWYCLLECPGRDQPGRILDIAAWAKEHGWHVPTPPTRAPTFPDPPAVPGTYLN